MTAGSPSARVGLALISKNEAERLPTLLASVEGCFDRVVLLDTGSTDDTVKVFCDWAEAQSEFNDEFTWQTGHVAWDDDFAKARRQADNLLAYSNPTDDDSLNYGMHQVDWRCWADCDDVIVGAQNIKHLVRNAAPGVVAFMVDYNYAPQPDGSSLSWLKRERVVKLGHSTWAGPVHEAQMIDGGVVQMVDPSVVLYVHAKQMTDAPSSNDRNLRILTKWNEREPDNPRVLNYLGIEHALLGKHEDAVNYYEAYLALTTGWDEERAQVHSRLATSRMAMGHFDAAQDAAMTGIEFMPSWPDNYIRLAESYLARGKSEKAFHWAKTAMQMGAPQGTLLIVNPMEYAFLPLKLMAGALGDMGRIEEAVKWGTDALGVAHDQQLAAAMNQWQALMTRERTAHTYVLCADQLISNDEQLKALTLLTECVPVFAIDHPAIVAKRSWLRERINWAFTPVDYEDHYENGGSKPEDMIDDDHVNALCEALPRTNFLLDGVLDQIGATDAS